MAANRCREPLDLTKEDVDRLTDALKDEEFRKLLIEYCEETQSPEARANYQKEFTELEKQRGYLVTFITPSPGYVIKSSVAGDRKAFINICANDNVAKPTYSRTDSTGVNWSLPYTLSPPRDSYDQSENRYDQSKNRCVIYDVVFHLNTIHIASKNTTFKSMLDQTAFEAIENNHKVKLDTKNAKTLKGVTYKGSIVPSIIRKPDPNYKMDAQSDSQELLDQLYPQRNYSVDEIKPSEVDKAYFENNDNDSKHTIPKYKLKHRREIDMKEFTYEKDAKMHSAIPSHLVLEINLPLLSSSADTVLNIKDKSFSLISEKPSRYKLDLSLPYKVNDEEGSATFDLSKRTLVVTLPVVPDEIDTKWCYQREDSGVESDMNSPCGSDEDSAAIPSLVTVLSETPNTEISESETYRTSVLNDDKFFDASLSYLLPPHSCNVFDNLLVFTLDVKNVDSESIVVEDLPSGDGIRMKFDSIGAGFFPMHHAMILKVPSGRCSQVFPEVWDNNVVLQIEITEAELMDHYMIGLSESDTTRHDLKIPIRNKHDANKQIDFNKLNDLDFLQDNLFYSLPSYSLNVIDSMMAFTFKIPNVKADTFASEKNSGNKGYQMKFSSLESDKTLKHYSLCLMFPSGLDCTEPTFNVFNEIAILRLEVLNSSLPDHVMIGANANELSRENLDVLEQTQFKKIENDDVEDLNSSIEVTTKGRNETSIIMSRNEKEYNRSGGSSIKLIPKKRNETYDGGLCSSSGSFKGILKYKSHHIERSLSESNVDLMDYNGSPSYSLSSADCIPEESSSLKKTVRFSDVIGKQTFRSNSSILGQKSKNQRKKRNKKRAIDRRTSEGENDDGLEEVFLDNDGRNFEDMKINDRRRDSGLADTDEGDSDKADGDNITRDVNLEDDLKSSQFPHYNSKESKQGKYPEVNFKNDLIFDLDM